MQATGQTDIRAALDAQYNLRAAVPDHPAIFARWRRDSAAVRAAHPDGLDIAYGPGPRQRLDLFRPTGGGPFPALVFVHGGYWQAMAKEDFACLAPAFLAAGCAFVAIGYDLCPSVRMATLAGEVAHALGTVAGRAADWHLDPARLVLAGHSAGGHLTAHMLLRDWAVAGFDRPPVRAGVAVSGVYDLAPVARTYLNAALRLDAGEVEALSPIRRVHPVPVPLVLAVGAEETEAFRRQQDAFADAWRACGNALAIVDLPGRQHFDAIDALGEKDHPLHRTALALCTQGG